jgi:hypothetical protein
MKGNRPKLVLVAVAAAALGVVLILSLRTREPVYQGEPVSYWLGQLRTTNRTRAELAFQEFGTNAIPLLGRKLRRDFSFWQTCYRAVLEKVPAVVRMVLRSPPNLDDSFNGILEALKTIGPSSLPSMTGWLDHRSKWDRLCAILVIGDIDPAIWPNRQEIIQGLDRGVRQKEPDSDDLIGAAACALGRAGPDGRDAVPALRTLLGAPTPYHRAEAAVALWRIEHTTNVLPVLKRELDLVPFAPTRSRVVEAVTEIEGVHQVPLPVGIEKTAK